MKYFGKIQDNKDLVTKEYVDTGLSGKQNTLTFDTTPTAGSTNPVTSGGIKSAITAVKSDLTDIHAVGPTNGTGANIAGGTYFYLAPQSGDDEILVCANEGINSGATFTLDTNYQIVTAGALNYLNKQMFVYSSSSTERQTFDLSELIPFYGAGPALMLSVGHHDNALAAIVFLDTTYENKVSYILLGRVASLNISSISFNSSTKTLSVNFNTNPYRRATIMALTQLRSW